MVNRQDDGMPNFQSRPSATSCSPFKGVLHHRGPLYLRPHMVAVKDLRQPRLLWCAGFVQTSVASSYHIISKMKHPVFLNRFFLSFTLNNHFCMSSQLLPLKSRSTQNICHSGPRAPQWTPVPGPLICLLPFNVFFFQMWFLYVFVACFVGWLLVVGCFVLRFCPLEFRGGFSKKLVRLGRWPPRAQGRDLRVSGSQGQRWPSVKV